MRRSYRDAPVRLFVVMGESNAYGMCATDPDNEWVQVVASQIRRHQDGYLRVMNNAIPSNVISQNAPGYVPFHGDYSTAPSALERYVDDMIALGPDLCIFAYGFNDARCGHALDSFISDYEAIVSETRASLPDALIVLVGPYWAPQFSEEPVEEDDEAQRLRMRNFACRGSRLVESYRAGIAELAARHDCLFVDVYRHLEHATWLMHEDDCHFNDAGQAMIGLRVFAEIASNCAFLGAKASAAVSEGGFTVIDTGGTNALAKVVSTWRLRPGEQRQPRH